METPHEYCMKFWLLLHCRPRIPVYSIPGAICNNDIRTDCTQLIPRSNSLRSIEHCNNDRSWQNMEYPVSIIATSFTHDRSGSAPERVVRQQGQALPGAA